MPAGSITTYEVYLVDNGRWALHARYRREEREKALEEARNMERELNTQVKVVREIYDPSDNTNEETTIYTTERGSLKPRAPAARGGGYGGGRGGGGGGGGDWSGDTGSVSSGGGRGGAATMASKGPAQMQGTFGALGRLTINIIGSLVGAGLITKIGRAHV